MEKYEKWKEAFDGKVLHVNVGKTIDMQILDGRRRVTAKFDLCGVCGEWIGCSSIKCLQCKKWVHRRWADVSHKVSLTVARDAFVYSSCLGLAAAEVEVPVFKYDSYHLEVVVRFYYLGDMLNSYGSVAEAVGARIGSAWIKLWELTGLLTDKLGQSLKQRRKICRCCIRPVLLQLLRNLGIIRGEWGEIEWGQMLHDKNDLRYWTNCVIVDMKRQGDKTDVAVVVVTF